MTSIINIIASVHLAENVYQPVVMHQSVLPGVVYAYTSRSNGERVEGLSTFSFG